MSLFSYIAYDITTKEKSNETERNNNNNKKGEGGGSTKNKIVGRPFVSQWCHSGR